MRKVIIILACIAAALCILYGSGGAHESPAGEDKAPISIFPEKVEDYLNISSEIELKARISMTGHRGETLCNEEGTIYPGVPVRIDMRTFENGKYEIRIITDTFTYSKNIIKI